MPLNNILFYKTAHKCGGPVIGHKGLQSQLPAKYLCSPGGGKGKGYGWGYELQRELNTDTRERREIRESENVSENQDENNSSEKVN